MRGPVRACAAPAGRTDASGSSRGSSADGDAETVDLQGRAALRANPDPGAAPGAPAHAGGAAAAAAEDPTVIVSRAPRPAFGRAFAAGGAKGGPRRLGAAPALRDKAARRHTGMNGDGAWRCLSDGTAAAQHKQDMGVLAEASGAFRPAWRDATGCALRAAPQTRQGLARSVLQSHRLSALLSATSILSTPPALASTRACASFRSARTPSPCSLIACRPDAGLGGGAARIAVRPPGLRLAPTAEADETGGSAGGGSAGGASRGSATPSRSASPPDAPSGSISARVAPHPGNGACAAAAGLEAGAEAGRKRKADAAAAPRSPTAADAAAAGATGCKRRQSPEAQVLPDAKHSVRCLLAIACARVRQWPLPA